MLYWMIGEAISNTSLNNWSYNHYAKLHYEPTE